MERLLLQSSSKEDIRLIAELAKKMGVTIEYLPNDVISFVNEPDGILEWEQLSKNQQQGLSDAIEEMDTCEGKNHDDVISAFRKKYE